MLDKIPIKLLGLVLKYLSINNLRYLAASHSHFAHQIVVECLLRIQSLRRRLAVFICFYDYGLYRPSEQDMEIVRLSNAWTSAIGQVDNPNVRWCSRARLLRSEMEKLGLLKATVERVLSRKNA